MRKVAIGLLIFIWACSKDPEDGPPANDEKLQQTEIVSILSGNGTIAPGYKLPGRAAESDKVKVRTYLKGLINLLSLTPLEHNYVTGSGQKGTNIYATLPATANSTEYIIVGAHYDTVSGTPGANDNATGVAMIFGVIKELNKVAIRNKHVMFVFFDDEDIGLIGSHEFANKILAENLNVHSVHTVDQIGWDKDGDRAIELELPTDALKAKYQAAALESSIPIHVTTTASTDHSSFRNLGFKAIGLSEEYKNGDTTPYYHLAGDTYATIYFGYLTSSTLLMSKVITNIVSE
jgi:Zn-dependent M28 family amino/carboxypeptidase